MTKITRKQAVEIAKQILLDAEQERNQGVPAGLPESWYYSDDAEEWIVGLIKRAVREVLQERLYWYPQPNWWQPKGEGATHPLRYRESTHTGDDE